MLSLPPFTRTKNSRAYGPYDFIATFLTHFFGASADGGRSLQLGGSISAQLGKLLKVNPADPNRYYVRHERRFFRDFRTPLASAIFAMEVISIGIMHYSALVPCVFASLIASIFSKSLGVISESFYVSIIPDFNVEHFIKMIFLSIFSVF